MAGRFSVEAVFKAVDKMTAPMRNITAQSDKMSKALTKDMRAAQIRADKLGDRVSNNLAPALMGAAVAGTLALGAGLTFAVKKAAEMEDATASFTTMLGGSSEAASKLVGDLQVMGARTPFEFKDLQDATVMLMGFGAVTKDTAVDTLSMLGDLAQGSKDRLSGIALAYGQIQAAGKASLQDVNQLINNQVPILQQLAKQWGVTVGQAREMIKTRGTAEEITKAMKAMTAEGGMFFGGMMRSSKTFNGLWSTFMDAIGMTAAGIGNALLPKVKEVLITITELASKVLEWVNANKELISEKVTKWFNILVGIGKILFAVFSTVIKVIDFLSPVLPIIIGMIAAWKVYQSVLTAVAIAQGILNVVMSANPIGLIVIAIGALIGALALLYIYWDDIKTVAQEFFTFVISAAQTFINYVKQIGKSILSSLLAPIQAALELVSKIPGVGKLAGEGAAKIQSFRESSLGVPKQIETTRGATAAQNGKSQTEVIIRNDSRNFVETGGSKIPQASSLSMARSG